MAPGGAGRMPAAGVGRGGAARAGAGAAARGQRQLRGLLGGLLERYWARTPTAAAVLASVQAECDRRQVAAGPGGRRGGLGDGRAGDHFALRSFAAEGCGIDAAAKPLEALGYERRERLAFPGKKLQAHWFSPPGGPGRGLPRVFISELEVDRLSATARAVLQRYLARAAGCPGGPLLWSAAGALPWGAVDFADYEALAAESEYAAWTLVNGYAVNHATVPVHSLREAFPGGIEAFAAFLDAEGFALNRAGGVVKASPDGLLRQGSTMSDDVTHLFADGQERTVPGAFIEFAERSVLPEFDHLPPHEVEEAHRRDGFEAANADKIFESTSTSSATGQ